MSGIRKPDAEYLKNDSEVYGIDVMMKAFAASPGSKNFEHTAFGVSYPENWQLTGDRNSSVTIFPQGGASAESVAYGVILSGFQPGRGGDKLDEAMRQLVESVRGTNPDLRPAGNTVDLTINGKPAKGLELLGTSAVTENDKPIPERVRLVALPGKGKLILYMVFVAPDADFDALRPTFDRITRSFVVR